MGAVAAEHLRVQIATQSRIQLLESRKPVQKIPLRGGRIDCLLCGCGASVRKIEAFGGSLAWKVTSSLRRVGRQRSPTFFSQSYSLKQEHEEGALVAEDGDMVAVHYRLMTEDGQLLDSSEGGEPLTFEVGAGNFLGHELFKSFDKAARGLTVGEKAVVQSPAGARDEEMVFRVPRTHEEVTRLERVAAESANGAPLAAGSVVELANGNIAVVLAIDDEMVTIDGNHPLAGTTLDFEVEIVSIDKEKR